MTDFKPNVIKLSSWGNSESIARGQKSAGHKLSRCKVTCSICFKRMSAQAFRYHKQKVLSCKTARGEME